MDVLEDLLARFGEHPETVPNSLIGVFVTIVMYHYHLSVLCKNKILHCNENTLYGLITTNN